MESGQWPGERRLRERETEAGALGLRALAFAGRAITTASAQPAAFAATRRARSSAVCTPRPRNSGKVLAM